MFQIWCRDGSYHEVPLKEGHTWTREGCKSCPDFAAEHADISTGGIGELKDWTLTVIRSDLGQEIIDEMVAGGALEVRPGEDDPGALALMGRLSTSSRRRWPVAGVAAPGRGPAAQERFRRRRHGHGGHGGHGGHAATRQRRQRPTFRPPAKPDHRRVSPPGGTAAGPGQPARLRAQAVIASFPPAATRPIAPTC